MMRETIDSSEKRLENIAKRARELPKEHLINSLLEISKKDRDREEILEYSRNQKEGQEIIPHQHIGVINSRKTKALDKIFKALNEKISDDYSSLRTQLNESLIKKLHSDARFNKIMDEKLVGNKDKIRELFDIVRKSKKDLFEEMTGIEVPEAKLKIVDGGLFNEEEGSYHRNVITIASKPSLSTFSSKKTNNREILNSLIHELTHQEQERFVKNSEDIIIKGIKDQADIFQINRRLYLANANLKIYKRQPMEEEAFKTGDYVSKELLK